jgi:hypothetical protein
MSGKWIGLFWLGMEMGSFRISGSGEHQWVWNWRAT